MKIITFQHKSIVDILRTKDYYKCKVIGKYHKNTPNSYKLLSDKLKDQDIIAPIFGWSQLIKNHEIDISDKSIYRMLNMTGFDLNNYYIFELDVPDNEVIQTDFYYFVDLRFSEEFPGDDDEDGTLAEVALNNIFITENTDEIQAVLSQIKREWVRQIFKFENTKMYSDKYIITPIYI